MMDLLVQATTSNKISPSDHTINLISRDERNVQYKPSTPIGALDANTVYIIPKSTLELPVKRMPKLANQPFEQQTFRLQVNLPLNQRMVLRVSPRITLDELKKQICSERELDFSSHHLVHPAQPDTVLDLNATLEVYGCAEISLMSNSDNYAKAKKKSEKALDTSNLESDAPSENERLRSRKQKRKRVVHDDDSNSADEQYNNTVHKQLKNPPPIFLNKPSEENMVEITTQILQQNLPLSSPICLDEQSGENMAGTTASQVPSSFIQGPSASFPTLDLLLEQNEPTPFQKEILKSLEELKMVVNELIRTVKSKSCGGHSASSLSSYEIPSFDKLPVDSVDQLNEWENYLNVPENFSNCVKYLGCYVSHDVSSSVRAILSKIMTNNFARNFNWNGKPPKTAFKSLKSATLILCAIKENPLSKEVQRTKVEDIMKDWLKHATFRFSYKNKNAINH